MNIQPKKHLLIICTLLSVMILASLACSIGGISVGKDSATIRINLNENQVNDWLRNTETRNDSPDRQLLDNITAVEMHEGYMRIFGEDDGVNGSFDVSIEAENDMLMAQIIDVDMPGVDMDDPRIVEANEELTEELSEMVTESNGEVLFKEAAVEEGELKLQIELVYQK
ncbi:MAG: hypothetical protein EHM41_03155 [Chloroflexi bacterium]|nr:MAG: hypothetical protein EHM41_03155 [Chloroflexota bacterium]